tara:strand:+ start:160 stop:1467 length:1308 start_codon:yes stop_codon:yes gene_type:complete
MKIFRFLILASLISIHSFGNDIGSNKFKFSKVMAVPDLTFLNNVFTGLDILEQMDFEPLKNKNIAILSNHTAVNRNGKHLLDLLKETGNINVHYLLAMEHGIWGIDDKRSKMIGRDQVDPVHNAPIIDLFNTYLYPPRWVMEKIDMVLIDFQDTGTRYSTNIATMSKVFESASNHKVPVVVLDRPNPIRGDIINGPVPRTEFQSYESYHLFPIRHGLTIGEMAIIINEMGWAKESKRVELNVIPLSNWKRDMWFSDTGIPWRNPNPYINKQDVLIKYVGMDLFRGTNMNVGFGTNKPYTLVGAPWLVTSFLLEKLNNQNLPGVEFKEIKYRPGGSIYHQRVPKHDSQSCSGIEVIIKDINQFNPLSTATSIMLLIERLHPREFQWEKDDYLDKLFGTNDLRVIAAQKKPLDHLPALWAKDVYEFNDFRQSFLIYK